MTCFFSADGSDQTLSCPPSSDDDRFERNCFSNLPARPKEDWQRYKPFKPIKLWRFNNILSSHYYNSCSLESLNKTSLNIVSNYLWIIWQSKVYICQNRKCLFITYWGCNKCLGTPNGDNDVQAVAKLEAGHLFEIHISENV